MVSVVHLPYTNSQVKLAIPYPTLDLKVEPLEGVDDPDGQIKEALQAPLDTEPLSSLAEKGRKVAILVEGLQVPGGYRKRVLSILLGELHNAGVKRGDVTLIVATGIYRKPSRSELIELIGREVFESYMVIVHDCEESRLMVNVGETPLGGTMEVNRWVAESDLVIVVSKVLPWGAWGGYNSGARMLALDLTSAETASQYYDLSVVSNPSCNGDPALNPLQKLFHESARILEEARGSPLFFVELVATTNGQLLSVKAGSLKSVERTMWAEADRQYVARIRERGELLVVGVPSVTFLGESADNNAALLHAITFTLRSHRVSPVIRKGGLVLTAAECAATKITPVENEALRLLVKAGSIEGVVAKQESVRKPMLIKLYKDGLTPHPLHPLFSLYTAAFTLEHVEETIVIGCNSKLAARELKIAPSNKLEEALRKVEDHLGPDPVTVISPEYFTKGPIIQHTG
ncbi:MAG: DUF2088 domain-containing protein [Candidatus Freyarchaeota archaeon]|nr:DUF2088 domain-containing protein [Candidatus Jordarchaeia archaeon]